MSSSADPRAIPTRRSVLLAAALGGLGALAGCGLRLEHDAPDLPVPLPRQTHPSVGALTAELHRCRAAHAAALADRPHTALAASLAPLHAQQVAALGARLASVGSPATGTPTAAPGAAPTPTSSRGPADTGALLAAEQATSPAETAALARLGDADARLVGAARVQRALAVRLLTRPGPPPPAVTASSAQAAAVLTAARSARYALQVAAAHAAPAREATAGAALERVHRLVEDHLPAAGAAAPPPPLGYTLPFPVTTPAAADRLARQALTRLTDALVAALGLSAGRAEAGEALIARAALVEESAFRWGAPLRALPGAPTG